MGRKEDEEENGERPVADAKQWQSRPAASSGMLHCDSALAFLSNPCREGAFLPVWMLQLTSPFENLKLPDHRPKVSLGSLLSLPIAYKAQILPKTPPAARSRTTPKTQSGSGGSATSLGVNAHPGHGVDRHGVDSGKSCPGILWFEFSFQMCIIMSTAGSE